MKHTNLTCIIAFLAILSSALIACKGPAAEVPLPLELEDQSWCGLTVTGEGSPWHQVWRTDLGEGGSRDLVRDGDWLWVATPVDLVRLNVDTLDCARFSHTVGDPGMSLRGVRGLLPDPDGQLWAVGSTGLARFDGQHWQTVLADIYAYNLAFDTQGNLWAQVSMGRSGAVWFRFPSRELLGDGNENGGEGEDDSWAGQPPDRDVCDQWVARSGEFRSTEECQLLVTWRERLAFLAPPEGIAPWGEDPPIAAETDDRLWMLAQHSPDSSGPYDALLSFDGRNWRVFPWPYDLARLVADEVRGGVWAATREGVVFSDGQNIQKHLLLPGDAVPVGPDVYDLAVDGDGRLWASTSHGLLIYDEMSGNWQPTEISEGVLLSIDYQGGVWVASFYHSKGVGHFDGSSWSHYPFPQDWPCSPVVDILADVGGGLWLSSHRCALRGFNGQVWDEYDSGSRGDLLARGPDGAVYAAAWDGTVKRYAGTFWETLLPADPLRRARVIDLAVGRGGEVWVAFDISPSLIVYRDGEWEEPLELAGEIVTALLVDSQGDLWAGYSGGLLHYDGETWEHITRGIPFATVNALAKDRQERIWVGGQDGLHVYDSTGK